MKDEIQKTREYLDYLENHYNNVQKAWSILQDKCKHMNFIYDDFLHGTIDMEVKLHDISKLSQEEFVQYRVKFFPTKEEKDNHHCLIDLAFDRAWKHHKKENTHHWENWTKKKIYHDVVYVVHNICDWMAMGMKFNDTAKSYYEKNKSKIKIPKWSEKLMYEIFECIY